MIVFQVKGQSHRLSTLKGSTKYTEDTKAFGGQLKPSKIKARSSRPCANCSLYRCAYDVHNYDAQQHTAGQIISPFTLQTVTIAQVLSVGGEGMPRKLPNSVKVTQNRGHYKVILGYPYFCLVLGTGPAPDKSGHNVLTAKPRDLSVLDDISLTNQ